MKDPVYGISRGICLVELHTTVEASQLFTLLSSMSPGFSIDEHIVSVNYGKRNAPSTQLINTNVNAASVALAAAQWTNQRENPVETARQSTYSAQSYTSSFTVSKSAQKSNQNLGKVFVNGVEYKKYRAPKPASFQYDETSRYYYDSDTGKFYLRTTFLRLSCVVLLVVLV